MKFGGMPEGDRSGVIGYLQRWRAGQKKGAREQVWLDDAVADLRAVEPDADIPILTTSHSRRRVVAGGAVGLTVGLLAGNGIRASLTPAEEQGADFDYLTTFLDRHTRLREYYPGGFDALQTTENGGTLVVTDTSNPDHGIVRVIHELRLPRDIDNPLSQSSTPAIEVATFTGGLDHSLLRTRVKAHLVRTDIGDGKGIRLSNHLETVRPPDLYDGSGQALRRIEFDDLGEDEVHRLTAHVLKDPRFGETPELGDLKGWHSEPHYHSESRDRTTSSISKIITEGPRAQFVIAEGTGEIVFEMERPSQLTSAAA